MSSVFRAPIETIGALERRMLAEVRSMGYDITGLSYRQQVNRRALLCLVQFAHRPLVEIEVSIEELEAGELPRKIREAVDK